MKSVNITKDIYMKDLVDTFPFSIKFLYQKGICCIPCGDVVTGTLEETAKQKGFKDSDIELFVDELNDLCLQYS